LTKQICLTVGTLSGGEKKVGGRARKGEKKKKKGQAPKTPTYGE